jgi:hypothetical protein
MKKCSTFLAIKEMQIKTTLIFHFTQVRIAIIKRINNRFWQECGKKEPLHTVCGNVISEPTVAISIVSSKIKIQFLYDPVITTLGYRHKRIS